MCVFFPVTRGPFAGAATAAFFPCLVSLCVSRVPAIFVHFCGETRGTRPHKRGSQGRKEKKGGAARGGASPKNEKKARKRKRNEKRARLLAVVVFASFCFCVGVVAPGPQGGEKKGKGGGKERQRKAAPIPPRAAVSPPPSPSPADRRRWVFSFRLFEILWLAALASRYPLLLPFVVFFSASWYCCVLLLPRPP